MLVLNRVRECMNNLTFDDLISLESVAWLTSFAYCLGRSDSLWREGDLESLRTYLIVRYDEEEQVGFDSHLPELAELAPIKARFLSPILLMRRELPLDMLFRRYGNPLSFMMTDESPRIVAACWDLSQRRFARPATSDERYLAMILDDLERLPTDAGPYLFMGGCPGWSYDHTKENPFSKVQKQVMKGLGFCHFQRVATAGIV